jgi:hypothetical protein
MSTSTGAASVSLHVSVRKLSDRRPGHARQLEIGRTAVPVSIGFLVVRPGCLAATLTTLCRRGHRCERLAGQRSDAASEILDMSDAIGSPRRVQGRRRPVGLRHGSVSLVRPKQLLKASDDGPNFGAFVIPGKAY